MGKATGMLEQVEVVPAYCARTVLMHTTLAHGLGDSETIAYASLFDAAERSAVCPTGEDLNDLLDYSSDSGSRGVVDRLAEKGLITIERFNRTRRVRINATGKWTMRDPRQASDTRQVPRGTHDPRPLLKALAEAGIGEEAAEEIASSQLALLRCERLITKVLELVNRRKWHYLTETKACS